MKNLFQIFLILVYNAISAQSIVYEWDKKENPNWMTSDQSENTLCYHGFNNDHNGVSTSEQKETFNNDQITTYTSAVYNFGFTGSLVINMTLGIKLKDVEGNNAYDWLYFQYSLDGGITWLNPVNSSSLDNNSNINLTTYNLGFNSNKGWSGNLSEHETESYNIPNTGKNQFRYVFVSNATINQGNGSGDIYHADIREFNVTVYNPLPIQYVDFKGFNSGSTNILQWVTMTETNNDYFVIQRSADGVIYNEIGRIQGAGTSKFAINYEFKDENPEIGTNYYRFIQYDYDGKNSVSKVISVEYKSPIPITIVAIYDLQGRKVDESFEGVKIVQYSNGETKKILTLNNQ